jgi:hypothetical protein
MPKIEREHRMRWLTPKEQETFRRDFQEKEREIQRYIGVYLSGLVLVTGWIIGPQSKPLISMILGNDGYNLYALLLLVVLNVIFINFLIYKSLIVHEVTQFVSYLSGPDSAFNYWESWRRSRQSVTKPVRTIYTISLALLPVFISALIMFILWLYIYGDAQAAADKLNQIEPSRPGVDARHLAAVFQRAKYSYWVVAALHLIPLYFFYHNVRPTNRRWAIIERLRGSESSFEELDPSPSVSSLTAGSPDALIHLFDEETGSDLGMLSEEQMEFLARHLVEETEADDDYYIDRRTIDMLKSAGADSGLLRVLRRAVGEKEGVEVRWAKSGEHHDTA